MGFVISVNLYHAELKESITIKGNSLLLIYCDSSQNKSALAHSPDACLGLYIPLLSVSEGIVLFYHR